MKTYTFYIGFGLRFYFCFGSAWSNFPNAEPVSGIPRGRLNEPPLGFRIFWILKPQPPLENCRKYSSRILRKNFTHKVISFESKNFLNRRPKHQTKMFLETNMRKHKHGLAPLGWTHPWLLWTKILTVRLHPGRTVVGQKNYPVRLKNARWRHGLEPIQRQRSKGHQLLLLPGPGWAHIFSSVPARAKFFTVYGTGRSGKQGWFRKFFLGGGGEQKSIFSRKKFIALQKLSF